MMQILWTTRQQRPFVLLLLLILLFITNHSKCDAQKQAVGIDLQNEEDEDKVIIQDLDSMSDKELELVCIERGFEVVEGLSHEEYVEAARRCLAIEEDM